MCKISNTNQAWRKLLTALQRKSFNLKVLRKKKKKKKNYHTFQQFSNFELLSKDSVKKLVLSVPTKSCSLDPVPTKVVKESLDELVPLLTVIIIHQIHYEKSDSSRAFNPNSQ